MKVKLDILYSWIKELYSACGMNEENAKIMADTTFQATLSGTNNGEHDISDVPKRIKMIKNHEINISPKITLTASYGALERWDGDKGPGEIICTFAMKQAMKLADKYGIGLCSIKNSNHCMTSSIYVSHAAEMGYASLLLCKGYPTVSAPGTSKGVIGALPMAYASPVKDSIPLQFDGCLAYASMGKLREYMQKGQSVPTYWGTDRNGVPTSDPAEILQGARSPIGDYKGFALLILGEILTSILSDGCVIDEEPDSTNSSIMSHTAIALKTDAILDSGRYAEHSQEMVMRMKNRFSLIHLPGEGFYSRVNSRMAEGYFEISDSLLAEMNRLSDDYHIIHII